MPSVLNPIPSSTESNFLLAALSQTKQRIDGRSLLQSRDIQVEFLGGPGEVMVSSGESRVTSSISHSIIAPTSSRPNEGSVSISCDFPQSAGHSMSGAAYEPNRQTTEEVVFERLLDKTLRNSQAVDKEGLCIVAAEKVFQLEISLRPISLSCPLLDISLLSILLSILTYRLPEISISGTEIEIHSLDERVGREIGLRYWPIGISLVCFDISTSSASSNPAGKNFKADGEGQVNEDEDENHSMQIDSTSNQSQVNETNLILIDPTPLELHLSSSLLSLVITPSSELVLLEKAGGNPLKVDTILQATKIAARRSKEISERIKKELKIWQNTGGRTVI